GDPRPPFATPSGLSIFPEDDDPWWLTELSRRAQEEPAPGDEDGPQEEDAEEGKPEDALTDDEDPPSEDGSDIVMPEMTLGSQPVPVDHVAELAWSAPSVG
ncbi:MAG: hypothetical protein QGI09_08525, partial [Dehalococcoidia bacterium]|nr:hypothetical protein [Dehalococcoidia bacterium]